MRIPVYQVDAFTSEPFRGNPAGVCPLEAWLPDVTLQAIAAELNLSETAFLVPRWDDYHIRWFTPTVEVPLCGHAALASAAVVLRHLRPGLDRVRFESLSGPLGVTRDGDLLELDFPTRPPTPAPVHPQLAAALGAQPVAMLEADGGWGLTCFAILEDAATVRALSPDLAAVARLPSGVAVVTAPGTGEDGDVDYVVRFFGPGIGIPEDPVTGAIQTTLAPYWAARLGRAELRARQVSARQGELRVTDRGQRVGIAGAAVVVLEGSLFLPD